jgi:hypothetical protein
MKDQKWWVQITDRKKIEFAGYVNYGCPVLYFVIFLIDPLNSAGNTDRYKNTTLS